MTELLEKAFRRAPRLASEDRDTLAAIILEEIADEERWAAAFEASRKRLEAHADEALAEARRGETSLLDPKAER
jgi:hypothetical protein